MWNSWKLCTEYTSNGKYGNKNTKTIRIHLLGVIMLMPGFYDTRLNWKKIKAVGLLFYVRLYVVGYFVLSERKKCS